MRPDSFARLRSRPHVLARAESVLHGSKLALSREDFDRSATIRDAGSMVFGQDRPRARRDPDRVPAWHAGMVVATGRLSRDAREFARRHAVMLLDDEELKDLVQV